MWKTNPHQPINTKTQHEIPGENIKPLATFNCPSTTKLSVKFRARICHQTAFAWEYIATWQSKKKKKKKLSEWIFIWIRNSRTYIVKQNEKNCFRDFWCLTSSGYPRRRKPYCSALTIRLDPMTSFWKIIVRRYDMCCHFQARILMATFYFPAALTKRVCATDDTATLWWILAHQRPLSDRMDNSCSRESLENSH